MGGFEIMVVMMGSLDVVLAAVRMVRGVNWEGKTELWVYNAESSEKVVV